MSNSVIKSVDSSVSTNFFISDMDIGFLMRISWEAIEQIPELEEAAEKAESEGRKTIRKEDLIE